MSTYNRLQIDDKNLQNKYLKYKYKYLKQKQIIQSEQKFIESLNLKGGGIIDYITNNPKTALATAGAVCYGAYCLFNNFRSNLSLENNISILLNSTRPTRYIYKYIHDKNNPLPENQSKITFSKFNKTHDTYAVDEYIRQGNWVDDKNNYGIDELKKMFNDRQNIHITDIRFLDHWSKTGRQNQKAEQNFLAKNNINTIYKDESTLNRLVDYEDEIKFGQVLEKEYKYSFLVSIIHSDLLEKQSHYIWTEFGSKCVYEIIEIPKLWEAQRQEDTMKIRTNDMIIITNVYAQNKIVGNVNTLARKISTNSTSLIKSETDTKIDTDTKKTLVLKSIVPVPVPVPKRSASASAAAAALKRKVNKP